MVKVTEGLYVKVTRHFHYSDFGVRTNGEQRYTGRRYIQGWAPGTGFFVRDSESHTYRQFVRKQVSRQRPRYWRFLLGMEPDFVKEIKAVGDALAVCSDSYKRQLLESYQNALSVARVEERMQRIIRGIKNKIGHKSNKFFVSVLSHYKSKVAQLEADMKSVEYDVKDHCSPATYAAYTEMVEAFIKLAACRRVWHYNDEVKGNFVQVHFDLGVFDYIRSENFLPVMRDSLGVHYYILPDCVLVAHSSVDFEIVPHSEVSIIFQELSIEEPVEVLSSRLGDAASMIRIPRFNVTYYFNHVRPVVCFTEAYEKLKATL